MTPKWLRPQCICLSPSHLTFFYFCVVTCVGILSPSAVSSKCDHAPEDVRTEKKRGDNGYRIKFSGNPNTYVPGEAYTVSLQVPHPQDGTKRFTGFMLSLESSDTSIGLTEPDVGQIQLYGDALTKYSDKCPKAVMHTSLTEKTEVTVLWKAPKAGSPCVTFRATVVESRESWFMDDGGLTKKLCEEKQENQDEQPEIIDPCCSCDEAKYEMTFEGVWSRQTHPKNFPEYEWGTHFSDIIGASHSADFKVWEYGGVASEGLKQVAEWGSTRILESELKTQSQNIRTIIKARGLWYPNLNGKTFAVFRVDRKHHVMSIVSMIGPSPDWIVGVTGLELCLRNCSWVDQRVLNLYPWDAGTDSGSTYMSPNQPTSPRERIRRITANFPNDPESPFYDPDGESMVPLAKLIVTKQRLYEKSCDAGNKFGSPFEHDTIAAEFSEDIERPECRVSEWSPFSECSATCGKGSRERRRYYLNSKKAEMMGCDRQLVQKEMCAAPISRCQEPNGYGGSYHPAVDSTLHGSVTPPDICAVTDWLPWTQCSGVCGMGRRTRVRSFLHRMGRRKCNIKIFEQEKCPLPECDDPTKPIDPECAVNQWGDWTPCNVTCGKGFKTRRRLFLVPMDQQHKAKCEHVKTIDVMPCLADRPSCELDLAQAKEVCSMDKDPGHCRIYTPRWYFDVSRGMCIQFTYAGCKGNANNFEDYETCRKTCESIRAMLDDGSAPHKGRTEDQIKTSYSMLKNRESMKRYDNRTLNSFGDHDPGIISRGEGIGHHHDGDFSSNNYYSQLGANQGYGGHQYSQRGDVQDCEVSPWPRKWSPCNEGCGRGYKYKERKILKFPKNGGKECPPKLERKKKCKGKHCANSDITTNRPSWQEASRVEDTRYAPRYGSDASRIDLSSRNLQLSDQHQYSSVRRSRRCELSHWGPWSECNRSCGTGTQERKRGFVDAVNSDNCQTTEPFMEARMCAFQPCLSEPERSDYHQFTGWLT